MEYHGKLYGRINQKYFDTGRTSEEFDNISKRLAEFELKKDSKHVKMQKCNGCGYLHFSLDYQQRSKCPLCLAELSEVVDLKTTNNSLEYWKKRCELAEDVVNKTVRILSRPKVLG